MLAPYSDTARSKLSDGERHVLGARLDERELDPVLRLTAPGRRELGRRDVDAHRPRTAPGEPGRDVGGAAPELDHVEAVDLAECSERRLRHAEDAPGDLRLGPRPIRLAVGVVGVRLGPAFAVPPGVVGDLGHVGT